MRYSVVFLLHWALVLMSPVWAPAEGAAVTIPGSPGTPALLASADNASDPVPADTSSGESSVHHRLYGIGHANANTGGAALTPFWLEHNRYGRVSDSGGAMGGFHYSGGLNRSGAWHLDWGGEFHARSDRVAGESWVNQAWIGGGYGPFRVSAGRWHDQVGMAQRDLSAGPSIWSPNSRPMTRVKAEITDFVPVPWTREWLAVKGGLSHGWFDGGREVEDFWLHEKYLYGRVGRQGRTPELYLGLIHMAQWGGYDTRRYGQLPESFEAYWNMFWGREGSADAPEQWQENRGGNSLGSWQAGAMWRADRWEVWLNKETIFEDGSGYKLRSPEDGVQGINLLYRHRGSGLSGGDSMVGGASAGGSRSGDSHTAGSYANGLHAAGSLAGAGGAASVSPVSYGSVVGSGRQRGAIPVIAPQEVVSLLTYEFWYTKSQSGPGMADPPTDDWDSPYDPDGHRLGGQDNYFHHGVYHEGWSYRDRLIGVPLITYDPERRRVVNNRVMAHHVAFMHRMRWATLHVAGTWSRNYGRYADPIEPALDQVYLMAAWEQSLVPWLDRPVSLRLDLGLDQGDFMGNRAGAMLSFVYRVL